jgi:hypothetical protein
MSIAAIRGTPWAFSTAVTASPIVPAPTTTAD